jgi:hypothetical protein
MGRNEAFLKNSLLVVGCRLPALGLKGQGVWDFGVEKCNVRKPLLVFLDKSILKGRKGLLQSQRV